MFGINIVKDGKKQGKISKIWSKIHHARETFKEEKSKQDFATSARVIKVFPSQQISLERELLSFSQSAPTRDPTNEEAGS